MRRIADNFCGYLNVGDDTFSYYVENHTVTLLPVQVEPVKRYEVLERTRSRDTESPEYLFGIDDNNNRIAMLRNGKFSGDFFSISPSIHFGAPVIIKEFDNTTSEWEVFHAITFSGGNINALFNPQMAVELPSLDEYRKTRSDGAREIKIRPWDDCTHSVDFEIDGEKATFTISVSSADNSSEDMGAYSLGKLISFIRFSFEKSQGYDKIVRYYGIVRSLVAILTARNNVFFEVYLSQRNSDNQFSKTGVCKIFDRYENYSNREWHRVIPIHNVFDYVPKLINMIAKKEVDPLLALLPEDNRRANQVSITNVQDMCTALEVAYGWSNRGKKKDTLIAELKKQIKEAITEFAKNHSEIDVDKETTISSAFQYLDYTLKQKILTMYDENRKTIDEIISKRKLPEVDEARVGAFVKLRNGRTHSGTFEWGDSADIYVALRALGYACLFRHIGLPDEQITPALLKIV